MESTAFSFSVLNSRNMEKLAFEHSITPPRFESFQSTSYLKSQDAFLLTFFVEELSFQFIEKMSGTDDVWKLGNSFKMPVLGQIYEIFFQ